MEAEIRLILTVAATEEERPSSCGPLLLQPCSHGFSTGLHTTAATVAEIRYGIARLADGRRKHDLHQAANDIFAAFPRQVLPFDFAAATAYADVVAGRERCRRFWLSRCVLEASELKGDLMT